MSRGCSSQTNFISAECVVIFSMHGWFVGECASTLKAHRMLLRHVFFSCRGDVLCPINCSFWPKTSQNAHFLSCSYGVEAQSAKVQEARRLSNTTLNTDGLLIQVHKRQSLCRVQQAGNQAPNLRLCLGLARRLSRFFFGARASVTCRFVKSQDMQDQHVWYFSWVQPSQTSSQACPRVTKLIDLEGCNHAARTSESNKYLGNPAFRHKIVEQNQRAPRIIFYPLQKSQEL